MRTEILASNFMMDWTTEPPQKIGWYWSFTDHGHFTSLYVVQIVRVKHKTWQGLKRGELAMMSDEFGECCIVSGPHTYWLGPIPKPKLPSLPEKADSH